MADRRRRSLAQRIGLLSGDPRLNQANRLLALGSQSTPILANEQGFGRLAQTLAGTLMTQRLLQEDRQRRETARQNQLAANQAVAGLSSAVPFTNPDTGEVASPLSLVAADLRAQNTPEASRMAAQLGLQALQQQQAQAQANRVLTPEQEAQQIRLKQAGRQPRAPQTVNVGGQLTILNPDGTLGAQLGPAGVQSPFITVPGVGLFNRTTGEPVDPERGTGMTGIGPQSPAVPGTGQRIPVPPPPLPGQMGPRADATTIAASPQVPVPAPQAPQMALPVPTGEDPAFRLPAQQRGAFRAQNLQADQNTLREDRAKLQESNIIDAAADRFGQLLQVQGTGSFRGSEIGSFFEGLFTEGSLSGDPETEEMRAQLNRITPLLRGGQPGAASDRDVTLWQKGSFGPQQPVQTNQNLIASVRAANQNARDRVAFREAYLAQNGTLRGADAAWDRYLDDNPIFDPDTTPEVLELNQNRQGWREYFAGQEPRRTGPLEGATVRRIR